METVWQLDLQFFQFINDAMVNPLFDFLCPVLRNKAFLIACYVVFASIVYQTFPKQFIKIALAGALTFLITDQVASSVIKPFFHRTRPCNDPHVIARQIIEHCGSGFSFVSSHAANSFGMAVFLSIVLKDVNTTLGLIIWASLVCFSQVYVGVHYPADIVAGGLFGIIIGTIIGFLYHKISTSQTKP